MTDSSLPTSSASGPCRVEDLEVDVEHRRVLRGGVELQIIGISFDLFLVLLRAAPNFVSVDELMRRVWPGVIVSPETVSQRIKIVRRALNDDAERPRYVAGVRGRGYRLVAPVAPSNAASPDLAAEIRAAPLRSRRYWFVTAVLVIGVALAAGILARGLRRGAPIVGAMPTGPTSAVVVPRTTVAVLPFANLTGDRAKEYLGDRLAEEVINMLARVPGLKVPARTSSFAYKGRDADIHRIAADLGVGTIVEGSIREAGSRIRITAELINAQDGLQLWSQSYDRSFTDLLQLQDDLASAIVQALQVKIGGASVTATVPASRTRNVEAYDLYLQGDAVLGSGGGPQSFQRAVSYFQAAVARDPTLAQAHAGLGMALCLSGEIGVRPIESMAAAERAARQAFMLDPALVLPQQVLSNVSSLRGHWLEAETYGRMALSLGPDDAGAILSHGYLLDQVGHLNAALAELDKAYALAPASLVVIGMRSRAQSLLGREDDALTSARLAEDLGQPRVGFAPVYEQAALRSGHYAKATAAALELAGDITQGDRSAREVTQLVYDALVDPRRKPAALAAGLRLYPASVGAANAAPISDATACLWSSYAYTLLGEVGLAYSMADRCLDAMAPGAINANNDRLWMAAMRPFRQDPRFSGFATRLGLMEYWQQYGPPDDCDLKGSKLTCH